MNNKNLNLHFHFTTINHTMPQFLSLPYNSLFKVEHSWPGVALMLQTLLIFISAMILLWNRARGSGDYDQF
jgi:hypothetical protein